MHRCEPTLITGELTECRSSLFHPLSFAHLSIAFLLSLERRGRAADGCRLRAETEYRATHTGGERRSLYRVPGSSRVCVAASKYPVPQDRQECWLPYAGALQRVRIYPQNTLSEEQKCKKWTAKRLLASSNLS